MRDTNNSSKNSRASHPIISTLLSALLFAAGWIHRMLGIFRSNHQIQDFKGFGLYYRERTIADVIDGFHKKPSNGETANQHKQCVSRAGSNSTLKVLEGEMTPSSAADTTTKSEDHNNISVQYAANDGAGVAQTSAAEPPVLSSLRDYPSLAALRQDKPSLVIGVDSEWQSAPVRTDMISWQFALCDNDQLKEFVFFREENKNLELADALGIILDQMGGYQPVDVRKVRRYKYCVGWTPDDKPIIGITDNVSEAIRNATYVYRPEIGFTKEIINEMKDKDVDRKHREWAWFHRYLDFTNVEKIKITVLCHFGRVDISSFDDSASYLKYLTEVHGGLVSMQPIKIVPKSYRRANNEYVYPVTLSVSDTMCHAPAGKLKLADLGDVVGYPKVTIAESDIKDMRSFLNRDPVNYTEYASTDSVVTLFYAAALYGYNNELPITMISAGAHVMKGMMMEYFECSDDAEFNRIYRGLEKKGHGKKKINKDTDQAPGFLDVSSLEPINNDANTVQYYASQAYHGGYNICCEVGYFPYLTLDVDLQNAYPTAMYQVMDIDWDHPIWREIIDQELTLADFAKDGKINPIIPFVGYVTFEFPDDVKFPSIPINVESVPTYPLTSEGLDGVYVAGPFIWLALKLGAMVYCKRGYFLRTLKEKDSNKDSHALASVVKQLVHDRNKAKKDKGKGSLEELILKEIVNAGYGKIAQNVIDKSSWDAYKDEMHQLGCSSITNPVSAMMITSIVQAELIAAQNQIHDLGYMSCSVTTDGFISDIPIDKLKQLDLFGLRPYMEEARLYLTDGKDAEIWEIKHAQDDLVNFTTRGNVSLHWFCKDENWNITGDPMWVDGKPYEGVCAHNGTKSGYTSDSYEDRLWLMNKVVSRTDKVAYKKTEFTSFKDMVHGKPLMEDEKTNHVSMDFDCKRKPAADSFRTDTVHLCGIDYEIAHFDTVPYHDVEEFKLYRQKKEDSTVLRTESDWVKYWIRIATKDSSAKPRDMDWAILNSCIMGYRAGFWEIPALKDKSVQEKCDWINQHNDSKRRFKPSDWKNARKPERQINMLSLELIKDKLNELMTAM